MVMDHALKQLPYHRGNRTESVSVFPPPNTWLLKHWWKWASELLLSRERRWLLSTSILSCLILELLLLETPVGQLKKSLVFEHKQLALSSKDCHFLLYSSGLFKTGNHKRRKGSRRHHGRAGGKENIPDFTWKISPGSFLVNPPLSWVAANMLIYAF